MTKHPCECWRLGFAFHERVHLRANDLMAVCSVCRRTYQRVWMGYKREWSLVQDAYLIEESP